MIRLNITSVSIELANSSNSLDDLFAMPGVNSMLSMTISPSTVLGKYSPDISVVGGLKGVELIVSGDGLTEEKSDWWLPNPAIFSFAVKP